jgi:cell division ATPase FtsA
MDVRIGFPGDKMAAESNEEINQPQFSTSVGLLLKGLEYYEEKQEEMRISQPEEVQVSDEVTGDQEVDKKVKKKGKILENLKKHLEVIFEEGTDVKMDENS